MQHPAFTLYQNSRISGNLLPSHPYTLRFKQQPMPSTPTRPGSRFAKRAYILRCIGLAIGLLPVATVLWVQHAPPWITICVATYCLGWPHLGYLYARRSNDPGLSERHNLHVDNVVGGLIVVAIKFALLPSTLVILMFAMNNVATGGWRLLAKGFLGSLAGILIGMAAFGVVVDHDSSRFLTFACMPLLVVYPLSLGIMSHSTALKLAERSRALKHLSEHDPLTGLLNRSTFTRELVEAVAYARESAGTLSVMFIDMDNFKYVNDSFGHQIGDELLVIVASRLRTATAATEKIARYGGDEFALLTTRPSVEAVHRLASSLVSSVQEPVFVSGRELHARISVGIGTWPADGNDAQSLMLAADAAMYAAKKTGKEQSGTALKQLPA